MSESRPLDKNFRIFLQPHALSNATTNPNGNSLFSCRLGSRLADSLCWSRRLRGRRDLGLEVPELTGTGIKDRDHVISGIHAELQTICRLVDGDTVAHTDYQMIVRRDDGDEMVDIVHRNVKPSRALRCDREDPAFLTGSNIAFPKQYFGNNRQSRFWGTRL